MSSFYSVISVGPVGIAGLRYMYFLYLCPMQLTNKFTSL